MGKAALLPLALLLASQGGGYIPPISPGWLIPIGLFLVGAIAKLLMWMSRTDATLKVLVEALDRSSRAQEESAKALRQLVGHEERLDDQEETTEDHETRIRALERGSSPLPNR